MPLVVDHIKNELTNDLRFCFFNLENSSRPNTQIKLNDIITFDVIIVNPSDSDIKHLCVNISSGAASDFHAIEKKVVKIEANAKLQIATISAKVISDPLDLQFFNNLAKISLKESI